MNYRHAFHAGNFADVVKHAVLSRVVMHLRNKPAPFRIIDTHGGPGITDLTGPEAARTGEWRDGIGRLVAATVASDVKALLAPYLEAVASFNPRGRLHAYPGSPALVQRWLRPQDRLIACELEPKAGAALARNLKGDARVKVLKIDAWTALGAYVPPKERRGLILIDPPYEQPDEFERLLDGLIRAHRKWPTGIYLCWYPLKEPQESDAFTRKAAKQSVPKSLLIEMTVDAADSTRRLIGSGLLIVNPPWTLQTELETLMPALASVLGREGRGRFRLDWLAREK